MRIVAFALWLILFLVLFAFAVNNTAPSELRLFGDVTFQAPLIALLLIFFLAGVVFGFVAMLPIWFRQRVEIRRFKRVQTQKDVAVDAPERVVSAAPESIQSVAQGARTTS